MGDTLGFVFAPALASLVLSAGEGEPGWEPLPGLAGVRAYFPCAGLLVLLLTPGFLYFGLRRLAVNDKEEEEEEACLAKSESNLSGAHWILIATFNVVGLLLASTWVLGMQLPLYAAYSHLSLSRVQGGFLFDQRIIICDFRQLNFYHGRGKK